MVSSINATKNPILTDNRPNIFFVVMVYINHVTKVLRVPNSIMCAIFRTTVCLNTIKCCILFSHANIPRLSSRESGMLLSDLDQINESTAIISTISNSCSLVGFFNYLTSPYRSYSSAFNTVTFTMSPASSSSFAP